MAGRPSRETPGIFQRGRLWWISYCGPREDGSWGEIRESSKSGQKKAAVELRKKRLREVANFRDGTVAAFVGPAAERRSVGELLDRAKKHFETGQKTRGGAYKSIREILVHLKPLTRILQHRLARSMDRTRLEEYVQQRRSEGVSDTTIDRELELLRRAYNLAIEDGKIAKPLRVPRLVAKDANAKAGFYERAGFEHLLTELPSQVLRDVASCGYLTGWRKGEILSLTWDAYDRETRALRLHGKDSKNDSPRVVTLEGAPELAAVIERRLAERRLDSPLIFHNDGRAIGDFTKTWQRVCVRIGLGSFEEVVRGGRPRRHYVGKCFHDFRRTAARNMVRAGVDPTIAKRITGHKTDSMFQRYAIVSESDLAEAMRRRAAYEQTLPTGSPRAARTGRRVAPIRSGSDNSSDK